MTIRTLDGLTLTEACALNDSLKNAFHMEDPYCSVSIFVTPADPKAFAEFIGFTGSNPDLQLINFDDEGWWVAESDEKRYLLSEMPPLAHIRAELFFINSDEVEG